MDHQHRQTATSKHVSGHRTQEHVPFQTETPYMRMAMRANYFQRYNIYAVFFAWLPLAAFAVLPTTFTSLKTSDSLGDSKSQTYEFLTLCTVAF